MMASLFFGLLFLLSILFLILGLISPKVSLFYLRGKKTRLKSSGIYLGVIVICCLFFYISTRPKHYDLVEVTKEYYQNQVRMKNKYAYETSIWEGRVNQVYLDTSSGLKILIMKGVNDAIVMCGFTNPSEMDGLKPGQKVAIKGKMMPETNMEIIDCSLEKVYTGDISEKSVEDYTPLKFNTERKILSEFQPRITAENMIYNLKGDNRFKFVEIYRNKKFEVNGVVSTVLDNLLQDRGYSVTLEGDTSDMTISFDVKDKNSILALNRGERVTISGFYKVSDTSFANFIFHDIHYPSLSDGEVVKE